MTPSFGYAEHKDDMLAAAQWLETRLKTAGLEVGAFRSHADTDTSILVVICGLFVNY